MWFYRNRFPFFSPVVRAIHHFLSILADVYEKEGTKRKEYKVDARARKAEQNWGVSGWLNCGGGDEE